MNCLLGTWKLTLTFVVCVTLAACGGGGGGGGDPGPAVATPLAQISPTLAQQCASQGLVMNGSQPGATPFIAVLALGGGCVAQLSQLRYTITPQAGMASRPVDVTFSMAALARQGYVPDANGQMLLPVFGLYANASNLVVVRAGYTDGSVQSLPVVLDTPPYADGQGIYTQPTINMARAPGSSAGFDYFVIKSAYGSPVIVDTDGQVRWLAPGVGNAYSTAWSGDGFVIGSQTSPQVQRLSLDGTLSTVALTGAGTGFSSFHHDMAQGRSGLLGLFNTASNIESTVAEFDPVTGAVGKVWDLGQIIAARMQQGGDDPGAFVRPGVDWFHMNSALYDAGDNSLIVSSRENFVIKIDYDSGAIRWILGDPSKYWYSFASLRAQALNLDAAGLYPIGQHALSFTQAGELLLFNDGTPSTNQPAGMPVGASRSYSAVSAYTINTAQGSATEAWRYDHGQSLYSAYCSSVNQLPGGGLLVDYAMADQGTHARLIGVDAQRNVVFDFQYPTSGCNTSWNAMPIALEAWVYP